MGRTEAKGKRDKRGNITTVGRVSQSAHDDWIKRVRVAVRGGDLDESPYAYKRIEQVIEAHKGTINIIHILTPIGVAMADSRDFDPYKD